jgi:hypothetical protein
MITLIIIVLYSSVLCFSLSKRYSFNDQYRNMSTTVKVEGAPSEINSMVDDEMVAVKVRTATGRKLFATSQLLFFALVTLYGSDLSPSRRKQLH